MYKWVDDQGRVHYSDKPQAGSQVLKTKGRLSSYDSISYETLNKNFSGYASSKKQKIVMYSTTWCGYCKMAKKYFVENKIHFVEYDIEKNAKAKRAYDTLGGRGVPVLVAGNRRMNGFSVSGFESFYGIKKE